jgi:rhodanese-related sulfurtransferase
MLSATSVSDLAQVLGTARAPLLIDVRRDEAFAAGGHLVAGAIRRSPQRVREWRDALPGNRPVVVYCAHGQEVSQGVAEVLGGAGAGASYLAGGFGAWNAQNLPLRRKRAGEGEGPTKWVTRERPKIDRIACPWLIRRFIDPTAVFLFVAPAEVSAVADRFEATPFDVENVFWSHRGELCTFDVMVQEFGLSAPPLERLATMVRAADTARLDLSPEAPGLLAASLGLSRMYDDDLEQLSAGMLLYDAFYRWCRDASKETHNWPTNKVKA